MAIAQNIVDIPSTLVPDAVEMLFLYLEERRAPTPIDDETAAKDMVAFTIIGAIAELEINNFWSANDTLVPIAMRKWQNLLKWMWFMHDDLMRDADELSRNEIICVLAQALTSLASNPKLALKLTSDESALKLVAKLWVLQDNRVVTTIPYASDLLAQCLRTVQPLSDVKFHSILDMISREAGDVDAAAEKALQRIRQALKEAATVHPECIVAYLFAAIWMTASNMHPMHLALLKKHAISVLTKAVVRITKSSLNRQSKAMIPVEMYFHFCWAQLPSTTGMPWISEALLSGLLKVYVNCVPSFPVFRPSFLESARHLLSDVIDKYLHYYSILAVTVTAFKDVSPRESAMVATSLVGTQWKKFTDILVERLVIKDRLDRIAKEAKVDGNKLRCHNVSHSTSHGTYLLSDDFAAVRQAGLEELVSEVFWVQQRRVLLQRVPGHCVEIKGP